MISETSSDGAVLAMHLFITTLSCNVITPMRHMLILVLRITQRLHPRDMGLSMSAKRIPHLQCISYLYMQVIEYTEDSGHIGTQFGVP
jgi:hypothetical protein